MNNRKILISLVSCIVLTQVAFAEKKDEAKIFKCTNAQGAVFYNDKPCPKKDKEKKLKAVKDPNYANSSYAAVLIEEDKELAKFDAMVEKELAENEELKKDSSLAGKKKKSAKPQADIASMTGAERENHYERMDREQKQIAREVGELDK